MRYSNLSGRWTTLTTGALGVLLLSACSLGTTIDTAGLPGSITFDADGASQYGIAVSVDSSNDFDLERLEGALRCTIAGPDGEQTVDSRQVTVRTNVNGVSRFHQFTPAAGSVTVSCDFNTAVSAQDRARTEFRVLVEDAE